MTTPDAQLAQTVAKILDIELISWQEEVLTRLFAAHRHLRADTIPIPDPVRGPYGECGAAYLGGPDAFPILCVRKRGHVGDHTDDGIRWGDVD